MNITVTTETPEVGKLVATITIDKKDVEDAISASYHEIASKYRFQGFRRGRAPRPVIDGIVGRRQVMADATSRLLNDATPQVLDQLDVVSLGQIDFDEADVVQDKSDYTISCTIDVAPVAELTSYEAAAIKLPTTEATEEEVERSIEQLRSYRATYEDIEEDRGAEVGDMVIADVKNIANMREYEGENRAFSLENDSIPQELRDGIAGMKVGEEKEIRWTRTHEIGEETREVDFGATVKVTALRRRVVPEITEENVKSDYGFDSVEELRAAVKDDLENRKKAELPQLKEDLIVQEIGKRVEMEIPETFVEEVYRENMNQVLTSMQARGISLEQFLEMQGVDITDYANEMRAQSRDRAAQALALDSFARHLGFEATEDEVESEFSDSGVADWAARLAEFRASGRVPAVREAIRRRKALEWLVENADITTVDADEFARLMEEDEAEVEGETEE